MRTRLAAVTVWGIPVALVLAAVSTAQAQATIQRLATADYPQMDATGVSADGLVVCGAGSNGSETRALRWTPAGIQDLGILEYPQSAAMAISGDGSAVTGYAFVPGGTRAFRWTTAGGMENLGSFGQGSFGNAINGDGTVIVGESNPIGGFYHAFRWTAGGMQPLADPAVWVESRAYGVSASGSVVVGAGWVFGSSTRAFRWENGVLQDLGSLEEGIGGSSWAWGVSADGLVTVGQSSGPAGHSGAIRWTPAGMESLGTLGSYSTSALCANADGSVIGGGGGIPNSNISNAIYWTQSLGLVDLNDYLPTIGVNLDGWHLSEVRGLSADGSVLVGNGLYNGNHEGFRIVIAAPGPFGLAFLAGLIALRRARR